MVPGKSYTPEDILRMVWRRKWLICLPFVLLLAGTAVYSRTLKDVYFSETLILVVPQQVPNSFVPSTVTTQIDQRLQMISQQVKSRTRLEQLILEFDLYPDMRRRAIMDDVIERMRFDIKIAIDRNNRDRGGGTALRLGYESTDPLKAMQVTEKLGAMFIEANLQDRAALAEGTDQFLEHELNAARARLEEQDRAIEEYRKKHPWDQAEEIENNRWAAVNIQQGLTAHMNAVNQARERLLFLEKMVADLSTPPSDPVTSSSKAGDAPSPQSAAAQLESAKAALRGLELRLKPEHPDIIKAKRVIAELERKAEQEALAVPLSPNTAAPRDLPPQNRDRLLNIRDEMDKLRRVVADGEAEEQRRRTLLAEMESRIANLPIRVREMAALTRDYATIKGRYDELLKKKETSRIAMNLERQQGGEQMRTIDPPVRPHRPIRPDRGRLNLLGAALGLALGLAVAGLVEYRDTSLRSDDDVLAALSLPVLALVPVMRTAAEIRQTKRRRLIWSVTAVTLMISAAGVLWTLSS